MIDLHLHLDGSIGLDDFQYLSKRCHIPLGNDFPNNTFVPMDCKSLEEYLTRFDYSTSFMQDSFNITYVTRSLINRLANMGYIYAEIRFAPLLHKKKGLSQIEVVEAAIKGLKLGLKDCHRSMDANLILCTMRHASEKDNLETVEAANTLRKQKVVGVDLAGAEALHPCSYYKNIFDLAKSYHLNITIHAGEATGSDEIMMAIDNGAKRIGHGVHLSLDEKTINKVKEHKICFEFCPTSNLQTKSLSSYKDVPLLDFIKHNILVTINSDNMTVSATTAIKEMALMVKGFSLCEKDVYELLKNSIENAFISKYLKKKFLKKIDENITTYFQLLKDDISTK